MTTEKEIHEANATQRSIIPLDELQSQYHAEDIAVYLHTIPLEEQLVVLERLPADLAAEIFVELDQHLQFSLFTFLTPIRAVLLLHKMSPDDATNLLRMLDVTYRNHLLQSLPVEDARDLRKLMTFDESTAGGLMNTEIVILDKNLTAGEAIHHIHSAMQEEKEIPYYAYVVDDKGVLVGVLSLRDVLLMKAHASLEKALSDKPVITLDANASAKEVAKQMQHYNFMALPVVNDEGHVLGVVTHDDIHDVLQDEGHEMMLGMVGVSTDETVDTPWRDSAKARLPWLFINLFTSACAAYIVSFFEPSIAKLSILAVLMPIIANQSGNTGQQALAVMLRQISNETFNKKRAFMAVFRECKIGLFSGVAIAVFASLCVYWVHQEHSLAVVFGISLLLDMLLGAFAGASMPLLFRQLGRDPAHASSIFLTMITDSAGFFIFLGLASIFVL